MEEDIILSILGWILVVVCVERTNNAVPGSLRLRVATIVGTFLLFISWSFAPWLHLRPHDSFIQISVPLLGELLPLAVQQLVSWVAGGTVEAALEQLLQIFDPPGYMLGIAMPAPAIPLRFFLLIVLPVMFAFSLVRFSLEMSFGHIIRTLSLIQIGIAAVALLFLFLKLPQIDGWGQPERIETGLLVLVSAPQIGYGVWLTIQALILLMAGGYLEARAVGQIGAQTTTSLLRSSSAKSSVRSKRPARPWRAGR